MTNYEIYCSAIRLASEIPDSDATQDYEDRAPYLIAAAAHRYAPLDVSYRRAHDLDEQQLLALNCFPLTTSFPLSDVSRSSTEKRRSFITCGSTFPSRIIILGLPEIIFLSFGNFRLSHDIMTSKQTSESIGVAPSITGISEFSIGSVAIFETRIVITSSDGWSSPS